MKLSRIAFALILSIAALGIAAPAQAAPVLGCFIDTPAFDLFTPNRCFQVGAVRTTAVFKVLDLANPADWDIHWFGASCTGTVCSFSISPHQTLFQAVRLTHRQTGQVLGLRATADYEVPF